MVGASTYYQLQATKSEIMVGDVKRARHADGISWEPSALVLLPFVKPRVPSGREKYQGIS
jgi:hypothetical protein